MDDDVLVADYITTPASPLPSTAAASPRRTRLLSTKRRRGNETRTARAAAGAAIPVDSEIEPVFLALHDVHEELRNGFASVRRELARLRAELVVVKYESASTLRRSDGIAAASDGRESGSGVVLERLEVLGRSVHSLGDRLPLTGGGASSACGAPRNSVELMAEIKVRVCLLCCPYLLVVQDREYRVRGGHPYLLPVSDLLMLSATSYMCCCVLLSCPIRYPILLIHGSCSLRPLRKRSAVLRPQRLCTPTLRPSTPSSLESQPRSWGSPRRILCRNCTKR